MGQKIREDKITALTQGGGNINLAAGAYLTIGGQQYLTSSALQVALPGLTSLGRYYVYAVILGGVVALTISQNVNSAGPAGFSSWKLVGAFMANGNASVGFGSFLTIDGVPTSDWIPFLPTGPVSMNNTTFQGRIQMQGGYAKIHYRLTFTGAPTGPIVEVNMPGPLTHDQSYLLNSGSNKLAETLELTGTLLDDSTGRKYSVVPHNGNSTTTLRAADVTNSTNEGLLQVTTPITIAANDILDMTYSLKINGWSNTSLKDL